jgi:hypothetical protein
MKTAQIVSERIRSELIINSETSERACEMLKDSEKDSDQSWADHILNISILIEVFLNILLLNTARYSRHDRTAICAECWIAASSLFISRNNQRPIIQTQSDESLRFPAHWKCQISDFSYNFLVLWLSLDVHLSSKRLSMSSIAQFFLS